MTDPTKILVVRHGETEWNLEGRIQGHGDSPLTEAGRRQAESLAARLRGIRIGACYSSDLGRAWKTAETIVSCKTDLAVMADVRLRERGFGVMEGLTVDEREAHPRQEIQAAIEPQDSFAERVMGFFEEIPQRHPGGRVLVVSHGGVLGFFLRMCLGVPENMPRRFRVANSAVNVVSFSQDGWMVETLGDVSHLEDAVILDDTADVAPGRMA